MRPKNNRTGRLASALMLSMLSMLVAMPASASAQVATRASGAHVPAGDGTIYIGTYGQAIHVIDEATERVERIPLTGGIPRGLAISPDRRLMYVLDISFENIEIVDLETRRTIDSFKLSKGNEKVRIMSSSAGPSFVVDPRGEYMIILAKSTRSLIDRYEVGEPTLVKFDLRTKTVTDTIPWPNNEPRERVQIMFSPDGGLIYFFADDVLIYDARTLRQVDRWAYAQSQDQGMGRMNLGFGSQAYDEPGYFTNLFRITEPVQNRQIMGIARVNLAERSVNFFALGPNEGVSFALAPGGRKGYGVQSEVGNYQFWSFDLETQRVEARARFQGRPRMSMVPSTNGRILYIYNAGNTVDMYDAETFQLLRTLDIGSDNTTPMIVVPRRPTAEQDEEQASG